MRALFIEQHGGAEVLKVGEVPRPTVLDNSVLVKMKFSALNHLDVWVRKGIPGLNLKYPHVLGSDGAGEVAEVGKAVTGVKVGDSVIVHPGLADPWHQNRQWESVSREYKIIGEHVAGMHAEFVSVPQENIFPKPEHLSWEEAASLALVFTTAWQMLVRRLQIEAGDTVLIQAAGSGVSTAGIQIAKVCGARVITTASSETKLKRAKELGADFALNYKTQDIKAEIKKITNGKGVDAVFDHVGTAQWENNISSLKWGGKFVTCGVTSGAVVELNLSHLFAKQLQVLGSTMGSKSDFPRLLQLLEQGRIKPVVDRAFPLEHATAAYAYLEGREQFGKVLLKLA